MLPPRYQKHWLLLLFVAVGLIAASSADAQELRYTIQVGIPGFSRAGDVITITPNTMKEFVIALYNFAVYAGGTVAIVMGLWGGLKWISAGGNPSHVESAKETIYAAILGLLLLLGSFVMLKTINPELVRPNELRLSSIQPVGQNPLSINTRGVASGSGTPGGSGAPGAPTGSLTASEDANFSSIHPDLLNNVSFRRSSDGRDCYEERGGLQLDPAIFMIRIGDGKKIFLPCDDLDLINARTLTIDPWLINQPDTPDTPTGLRDLRSLLNETGELNDVNLRLDIQEPSAATGGSIVLPPASAPPPSSQPIDVILPPFTEPLPLPPEDPGAMRL